MDQRIRVVPVNAIETNFLDRLALCLEERFLARIGTVPAISVPRSALNSTRGQLFLPTLLTKVRRALPDIDGVLLAVTDYDLYKTSHRFVFGDADESQGVAAISLHRLRSEFYGEEADPNRLFQRALKQSVHELGHAFGLKHCYNVRCAMHNANSVFEADNQMTNFCEACDRRVARARGERSPRDS